MRKVPFVAAALAATFVAGCGVTDLNTQIANVSWTPPVKIKACSKALPSEARLFGGFRDPGHMLEDISVGFSALPQPLQDNSVVRAIFAQARAIPQRLAQFLGDEAGTLTAPPPPSPLTHSDFYSFANLISEYAIRQPTNGGDSPAAKLFLEALSRYYQAYYSGSFKTYFSAPYDKPAIALTIGDTEITQAAMVFLELVFDFAFKSPVWKDGSTYYPGKNSGEPTVAQLNEGGFAYQGFKQPVRLPVYLPTGCQMTALKAQIISYVAQRFASAAAARIVFDNQVIWRLRRQSRSVRKIERWR